MATDAPTTSPAPDHVELDRGETWPALTAQLSIVGADEPAPEGGQAAMRWLLAAWSEGHDHLPLFLVHDLGHLLLRGRDLRFVSSRDVGLWSNEERPIRLAYEDRLLARWAVDPAVVDVHVAVAGMPQAFRDRAAAHAVVLALSAPLASLGLPRGNPAFVKSALETQPSIFVGTRALHEIVDEDWRAHALEIMERCTALLAGRPLFSDADRWDIAHLPDVPSESARRALREVHQVVGDIGAATPGALSQLRRAREVPVDKEQADIYPTGGFDAVSTKGGFENLVRSEVAYVGERLGDDDAPPGGSSGARADLDFFDLRYVEGELLYYTRDESPQFEARRVVTVVVDGAHELRHKLKHLPAQTLVLVLGVCVRLQTDLVQGLGPLGSVVTIALTTTPENLDVVQEELALLALSLRSEVAHRRALLTSTASLLDTKAARRIVLSPRAPPPAAALGGVLAWVRVGGERWELEGTSYDAADPASLRELVDELLRRT